jgi:hypothetical protein
MDYVRRLVVAMEFVVRTHPRILRRDINCHPPYEDDATTATPNPSSSPAGGATVVVGHEEERVSMSSSSRVYDDTDLDLFAADILPSNAAPFP